MSTRSALRRAGAASITALLAGGVAVAIAAGAGPAGATGNIANGPTYPAPGALPTFTHSGNSVDPGGVTYNFSGFDLTAFSQIAWGLDVANGPVTLSMEGSTAPSDDLTYNSALSNLAGGQVVFTGSTSVTGVFYTGPVATELVVTTQGPAASTAAFTDQASLPVPTFNAALPGSAGTIGGVVPLPSDGSGNYELHANVQFLAGTTLSSLQAAQSFFDNAHPSGPSVGQLNSSVSAGFYWTPPFVVDQASLPEATKGIAYSTTLTATGPATGPLTWTVASGTLPAGLSLSSGGVISGTPTTVGSSPFTVQVTDSSPIPLVATKAYTLDVVPIQVATTSLPNAPIYGKYKATLTQQGGKKAYKWAVTGGALPPGIKLSKSGKLTGAPTAIGTYSFDVTVTDSTKPTPNTATATLSIAVGPMTVNSTGVPGNGLVGKAYKGKLTTNGGKGAKHWSLSTGALPPGLKLAPSGALSGKPTLPGAYSFDVLVQDSAKPTADVAGATITIVIS